MNKHKTMDTVEITISSGDVITVSDVDYDRVIQYRWHMWGDYPFSVELHMTLHKFILGLRPADVPANYVVDHVNRKTKNSSRPNLRWVSPSFNVYNRVVITSNPYRGIKRSGDKWVARLSHEHIGTYDTARQAFMAHAAAAVRKWPLWAPTSDILVGPGLLSAREMQQIQEDVGEPRQERLLPTGVLWHCGTSQHPALRARYKKKWMGPFDTVEEAQTAYILKAREDYDKRWAVHCRLTVPLNGDGDAVIFVSGPKGSGRVALVPPELYHILTFEHSWCTSGNYIMTAWNGHSRNLHEVVYRLLNPCYCQKPGITIDHVNHDELDNTERNLRLATISMQASNKRKRVRKS